MRYLDEEPKGVVYTKLIEHAIKTCDVFMFVTCCFYNNNEYKLKMDSFLYEFKPYIKKIRHNREKYTEWPPTKSFDNRFERNIFFLSCDSSLKGVLLKPERLYGWLYPYYPEDLCFFRKGYCWLTSCAHEEFSFVITDDKSEYNCLESLGLKLDQEEYDDERYTFYDEYKHIGKY